MRRTITAVLGVLLGCGPENEVATHTPETTARTAEEASGPAESPPNVARATAAEIDESSIRTHLARLAGERLPLKGGAVTTAELGSVKGRGAGAEYMEQSFEEMGIPAHPRVLLARGTRVQLGGYLTG